MFRRVAPYLIFGFYWLLIKTWSKNIVEPPSFLKRVHDPKSPALLAIWHGDEVAILGIYGRYKVATMTSTSEDGELMHRVLQFMDIVASRGSSTRGGVSALKGLLRLTRSGRNPLVAVDGPKGPRRKAKPGIFELSRILGAPIFPAGVAVSRAFVFKKSWNKAYLPFPFSRLQIVWGEPLPAVTSDQDPHDPELALRLESALDAVGQQARKMIAEASGDATLRA